MACLSATMCREIKIIPKKTHLLKVATPDVIVS